MKVFLNDGLVAESDAKVSVSNPALLHGVGLFETLRAYAGRPFRLEAHVERMRRSAERFNMPMGEALARVPEAVAAVLAANGLKDARIRFTVTPPAANDADGRVTLLAAAQAAAGYPAELYEKGMTALICTSYRQSAHDPLAGHKTTSYLPRLLALRDAQDRQCGEALWFTPENLLAEGSISNVFLVKEGRLRTPGLDTPVLPGVTRAEVLDLARELGIPAEEGPCTIDDLLDAEEAFLTNAAMEVMPLTRVERRAIGEERLGETTRRLAEAYRERVGRACGGGAD